jgi:hypothetical protein
MFCSNCGAAEVSGRFCSNCGAPLAAPPQGPPQEPTQVDWSDEVSYVALMRIAEVRDRVARQTELAPHAMTGEEFMGAADKLLGPLTGSPIPTASIAPIAVALWTRVGVKTGKTQEQAFEWPVGRVIVAVLCSLGRRGMAVASVEQAADGVAIEAQIPSDWRSLAAELAVTVAREGSGTRVEAGTRVRSAVRLGQEQDGPGRPFHRHRRAFTAIGGWLIRC